jgi:hypothetical protein
VEHTHMKSYICFWIARDDIHPPPSRKGWNCSRETNQHCQEEAPGQKTSQSSHEDGMNERQ